jgi:hypothetical protein
MAYSPEKQEAIEIYYNIYKSINGVKPRWKDFDNMTVEEIYADLDRIQDTCVFTDEDSPAFAQECLRRSAEFMLACGAPDWSAAMRWAKQAA